MCHCLLQAGLALLLGWVLVKPRLCWAPGLDFVYFAIGAAQLGRQQQAQHVFLCAPWQQGVWGSAMVLSYWPQVYRGCSELTCSVGKGTGLGKLFLQQRDGGGVSWERQRVFFFCCCKLKVMILFSAAIRSYVWRMTQLWNSLCL